MRVIKKCFFYIILITLNWIAFSGCSSPGEKTVNTEEGQIHESGFRPRRNTSLQPHLMIKKDHPNALQIMHDNCRGKYEIINPDQIRQQHGDVEFGITKPLGEGDTSVRFYIYYRCVK